MLPYEWEAGPFIQYDNFPLLGKDRLASTLTENLPSLVEAAFMPPDSWANSQLGVSPGKATAPKELTE